MTEPVPTVAARAVEKPCRWEMPPDWEEGLFMEERTSLKRPRICSWGSLSRRERYTPANSVRIRTGTPQINSLTAFSEEKTDIILL